MYHFIFALYPFLAAFAYRARGGAISLGTGKTELARLLFWGIPITLLTLPICYLYDIPLWACLVCGGLAVGSASLGHSTEQTGTVPASLGMAAIVTVMLLAIIAPLSLFQPHFLMFVVFGALSAVAYEFGYTMKSSLRLFGVQWCVPADASWGEFFTGAFAFGLPLAIIGMLAV